MADGFAGFGEHSFDGGLADGAAGAFGNDEKGGERPVPCQGEGGDGEHVDGVAEESEGPVFVSFVGEVAGDGAETVADQFTKTGDKADDGGSGAEGAEERAADGAGAFVGHVGEEVDDAEDQDEAEGELGGGDFSHGH